MGSGLRITAVCLALETLCASACGGTVVSTPDWLVAGAGAAGSAGVGGAGGQPNVGGNGGSGADCSAPTSLVLATSTVLDPPLSESEPEGFPRLLWTGTELWVTWVRWTAGHRIILVRPVSLSANGVETLGEATIAVGDTMTPENVRAAWDGSSVSLFWAQDDGRILRQRLGPKAALLGTQETVVVSAGQQTIPTAACSIAGGYLLTWGAQQFGGAWQTWVVRVPSQGSATTGPSLLYAFDSDCGASLVPAGDRVYSLWATHEAGGPVVATIAALDPLTGAAQSSKPLITGAEEFPSSLVFETPTKRLNVALYDFVASRLRVRSGHYETGIDTERATIPGVTSTPDLAVDRCGRLAALLPRGEMDPNNPMPTGLGLQLLGESGVLGPEVPMPTGNPDCIESEALEAVEGGFAAAWIEYGSSSSDLHRALRLAYVRLGP